MTRLIVGRIGKPHGLDGCLTVQLTTDRPERMDADSVLFVDDRELVVDNARWDGRRWLVYFVGVHDRNAAYVLVTRELAAEPLDDDDGTLWVHELIGAEVHDEAGIVRGTVTSVVANPASDLMELDSGALVPLRFVTEGPTDGIVQVSVPEGLWDL
jgi:16S rRNA processing protein RimM